MVVQETTLIDRRTQIGNPTRLGWKCLTDGINKKYHNRLTVKITMGCYNQEKLLKLMGPLTR